MCLDRRKFLNEGFYAPLAKEISDCISSLSNKYEISIIDAGCGEGYYLRQIRDNICDKKLSLYGLDLSKETIRLASKAEKQFDASNRISFCVAGIFDMPFGDNICDFVLSVFAPVADQEVRRVLKVGSYLLVICPDEKHLYGLKEKIYDLPRENTQKIPTYDGFDLIDIKKSEFNIEVSKEFIPALFGMTPYFWKSSKETLNLVNSLEHLSTPCAFIIKIYKKVS